MQRKTGSCLIGRDGRQQQVNRLTDQ